MAGQKFPEVGLRAVFELSGFMTGYRKYQTLMGDVDRTTQKTAQSVNRSTQNMTSNVARSFSEFSRQSTIVQDVYDNLRPTAAIAEMQRLGEAFTDLGPKARVNVTTFDHLVNSGLSFADAMRVAGGQVQFNLPLFDRLMQRGTDVEQAFQVASSGAQGLGDTVTILGRSFTATALAVGGVTAALKAGIAIVRESVEAYTELSEATRQVRLQTGLLTQEASAWVNVSTAAGISTATSERAMTSFLGKIADLRREQLAGEESTNDFARAVETLGIRITDAQGNLRPTADILADVNRAFRELGPGIVSAQLATDLFGYSGRFLLPILVDQERSMADLAAQAQELGANLTALDQEAYEELRKANIRLDQAFQGVKNTVARGWVPAITAAKDALADFLNFLRRVDATVRALSATLREVGIFDVIVKGEGQEEFQKQLDFYLGVENEMARAAEQSAQDRADAAQEMAVRVTEAERKIREERQKVLEQMEELARRLREQLADIERDFARRWEDILVSRMRDAIESAMRLAWRYADLAREMEQRRADTIRDYAEREVEQRREVQKRIMDAERDAQERREDLETEHQRRLRDIQTKYLDTVTEAARSNDAVAVARAMRERARDIRDEQTRYADAQQDLETNLARQREQIERDRQEREQEQRDELKRALERIEENYRRQLADQALQTEREAILREMRYAWEREDFEKAKARQIADAQEAYRRELEELRRNFERQRAESLRAYYQAEGDLNTHLGQVGQQLATAYQSWTETAVTSARYAAATIASTWASEISRYRQYLGGGGGTGSVGHGRLYMAEGGVVEARSPTTVVMGEAGPETAVFMPGSASSLSVSHSFGRMAVGFEGLPGGMNTQQVQQIVYAVMTQLAKGIQIPR